MAAIKKWSGSTAAQPSAPPGWHREPATGILRPGPQGPGGAPQRARAVARPLSRPPALAMVLAPLVGLGLWLWVFALMF